MPEKKPSVPMSSPMTKIDQISDKMPDFQMKEEIDDVLKNWTLNLNGQPKNLLLLLSSLYEVWSKEDSLKNISLKDMCDDPKLAGRIYRKAMILFHDDKIKHYNMKEQYVAKQLYYILTKANEDHRK